MFGPVKKLARLGQWNGRKRSTRQEPFFRRLGQRRVLLRIGVVWLTMALVTAAATWWGEPMTYRVGAIYRYDFRARVDFPVVNHIASPDRASAQADRMETPKSDGRSTDPEKLQPRKAQSANADAGELPRITEYKRGLLLVERGQPIQEQQLELLKAEHQQFLTDELVTDIVTRGIALFIIFSLLTASLVIYVARFQASLARSLPMIAGVCVLVLVTVVSGTLLNQPPWHAGLLPLTFTAMVLTLAYNPQFALMMSFAMLLGLTVVQGTAIEPLLQQMGGLATAILLLRNVRSRTQLVQVATFAGLAYLTMTVATGILTNQTASLIIMDALRNCMWGSLAGFLLTGLLPVVERCFGIVTDISLLELADGSHPLLQELVRRAPGTYTHSITVATLAEAAAEAIGANPLLVRVGSYFHDVGKMLKPQYFIENQTGENRHHTLEPALSTLVIIGHVKDGLALAHQYQLPRPITDFIAQHHGTTLVEYFYREAMKMQDANAPANPDLEACFRYPGPKPQSRENGILMLADAVESTSRSMTSPTPGSLHKMVHDLLMKRLLDGQFEESGLNLTELQRIEESLSKSLIALFHARIKYPEAEPPVPAAA
jgi:putative nucleotidyltransferase with HDIG domain